MALDLKDPTLSPEKQNQQRSICYETTSVGASCGRGLQKAPREVWELTWASKE